MRIPQSVGDAQVSRQTSSLNHINSGGGTLFSRHYLVNLPKWFHIMVGYLGSALLTVLALSGVLLIRSAVHNFYFPNSLMVFAILSTAILWGIGPALFAFLLSTLALDYYVIPPLGTLNIMSKQGIWEYIPAIIVDLSVIVVVAQRERAGLKARMAEQALQSYAQQLEETNQKLEDANQMKDRFISIASHELKTPITIIRGQAQLGLRRLAKQQELSPDMEYIRKALGKINEHTTRLTSLIDELLDVSSIRAGKVALHKNLCDLREICSKAVEDQSQLTGRSIVLDMPSTPIKMDADTNRLAQVLTNLISNAVKYSPDGETVEVKVSLCDNQVMIKVQDHGHGIAGDQLEHIFETFYRTPEAEASANRGLGLGLAISKDIVEHHNGRIWCESELKKGSTFFVELPIS